MKTTNLTYDQYDEIEARIEKMDYKCGDWLPNITDVNTYTEMTSTPLRLVEFYTWVLNTYTGEKTKEYERIKKRLTNILYRMCVFTD